MAKEKASKINGIPVYCSYDRPVDLVDLVEHPSNPNKHGDKQIALLSKIIRNQGWRNPVIVSKRSGFIVAGHGRLAAAKLLNVEAVPVDYQDFANEAEEHAHLIADNRIAELAEIDSNELAGLLRDLEGKIDLDLTGFDEVSLDDILTATEAEAAEVDAEPQIDKAEELQAKWKTELGQVWELGDHRLLCGDSTDADAVSLLMESTLADLVVTDPPYGVNYSGGTTVREKLKGDETPDLYKPSLKIAADISTKNAACYLWHSDSKSAAVSAAVSAAGYEKRSTIIWNKNQAQFGALGAQYKTKHEPCYYLIKKGNPPKWVGPNNEVTVWDIDRHRSNEFHPTQKPVECMARPIRNHKCQTVYDPFLGSGTTLIACENLKRKCYGVELNPGYVAVILQRWADATGREPKLCS